MVDTAVTNVTIGATLSSSFSTVFARARADVNRFVADVRKSSGALQSQAAAFDTVTRRATQYGAAMRGAATAANDGQRSFRQAASAARETASATSGATRSTREYTSAMSDSNRATSLVVSNQRSLQSSYERTADSASKARAMVAALNREMQAASNIARSGGNGPDLSGMQRRLGGRSPVPYASNMPSRQEFDGYPDLSRMQRRLSGPGGSGGYMSGSPFGGGINYNGGGGGGGGGGSNARFGGFYGPRMSRGLGPIDMAGAYAGYEGAKYMFDRGAGYEDEVTKMRMSGMSQQEIQSAQNEAWKVSRNVRGSDVNSNMKNVRELRYAFGNSKDATNNLQSVQEVSSIMKMMNPNMDAEGNTFALAKALEEKGVANDPAHFASLLKQMGNVNIASGGKVTGQDYLAFTRKAKAAAPALSDDFMTAAAPMLIQRLGAPTAGNVVNMAERALVGGKMSKDGIQKLGRLGLYDFQRKEAVGSNMLMSDPDKWTNKVLLPAMEKAGVAKYDKTGELTAESKTELTAIFQKMYSNSSVAAAFTLFATQSKMIDKERALKNAVPDNAREIGQGSPVVAFSNMTAAFGNLMTALSHTNMPQLAGGLNMLADGMNALTMVNHTALGYIGEVAIGLLAMGPAVLATRLAFSAFVAPVVALGGAMTTATSLTGLFTASLTPLGAVLVPATAAIVSFYAAIKASNWLQDKVSKVGAGIETSILGKDTVDKRIAANQSDYAKQTAIINDPNTGFFGRMFHRMERGHSEDYLNSHDAPVAPMRIPGHAYGGSFTVRGKTGSDTNLVQFAATAGEQVTIDTQGSKPGRNGDGMSAKDFAREIGKGIAESLKGNPLGPSGGMLGGAGAVTGGDGGSGGGGGGVAAGGGRRGFMSRGSGGGEVVPGGPSVGPVNARGSRKGLNAEQNANAQESYNFWRSKGATHEQALAALGNEQAESGFRPGARGDGGSAHGIFQWHGDRRRNIMNGAGIDIDHATHKQQLEAAYWEMTKGNERAGGRAFFSAKSLGAAESALVNGYERPADRAGQTRLRTSYGQAFASIFSPDGKVISPAPTAGGDGGMPNLPPGTPSQVGAKLRQMKAAGLVNGNECVALANASVGVRTNVHDWRRGQNASEGGMVAGTPISTFLNRDGSQSSRYAGGGSGTRGAGLDHAAVFENYVYQNGKRVGMRVAEQYARSGGVRERNYMFGQGRGEHNGSNYAAILGPDGNYLGGSRNPMASMALARAEAARKKQASAGAGKGGGGKIVHAPVTVHTHDAKEAAKVIQAHLDKHSNDEARGHRAGSFDWQA